ncbi:WD40 repeat-like protein [Suillus brevipes Sb2]|nr:WD40 repeat-like protein [Suillus brevipes Sb2]
MTNSYVPASHRKPVKTFEGYDGNIFSIATFPDGKRIATATADKTIRIILASGSGDNKVILWDTSTWQSKGRLILCGSPIPCIRFSPTGLLAVATDKGIQIWDLNQRKRLAHLDSNNAHNNSLAWTRDSAQR